MRILVYDVAASSGGALTVLNSFYEEFCKDTKNEYIFVLSVCELKEQPHIKVLNFPWIKKSPLHRMYFDQVLAAQTLVNRGLVFHKPSRTWYRRESSGGNYGTIACREKFQVSSWAFVPCSENVKMMEVLSPGEVNDCLKQLSQ